MNDIAGSISAITTSNNQLFIVEDTTKSAVSVDGQLADVNLVHISKEEYEQLVVTSAVISNTLYVVSADNIDAYGQQIKNVASPTDLSDAVNKEYVDNTLSNVQIPTDLSAFTNSPGYTKNIGTITGIIMNSISKGTSGNVDLGTVLTAHQPLSDYYTKGETSSAAEVGLALDSKANADAYLPLSGGTMSGDIALGKDNQIVFGSNEDGAIVLIDPLESDFGIHLSTEEDGEIAYELKYVFSDTYSGFNVEQPIEEGAGIIRSGDLYAALSSKAELNDIPSQVSQLENDAGYLTAHQPLSDYYTKGETSSVAEIATAFQLSVGNKIYIDDKISGIAGYSDLSIVKLQSAQYAKMVADDTVLSNAIYVVDDNYNNAFGAQIKNLAPGTDLSDAVNVEQLNSVLSGHTYDLNTDGELTKMVVDLVRAFGGTVLNSPS